MFSIHFFENNARIFNQALRQIPTVDEDIRIKGRKGKIINVIEMEENVYHVHVEFEKVVDKHAAAMKEFGKKKKR
ncbi:hypothetical protein [Psychrobacillus sp.]|uniref:hypothetical protein n=1 Tax=Psychrobacillus sp. TaxID=1871623 RepID=UPI0028BE6E8B|nr:hypothetical protein [Psychrobacillus sp.]